MAWTRRLLRQRIGESGYCGDGLTSSAMTGSSASQIVDTTLKHPDDSFVAGEVYVTSGSAENDIRVITDWTQSTGILLPDRDFSAAIASTNTYEIHRRFPASRKNQEINQAILDAKWRWARWVEDTSHTMVTDTYTYRLDNLTLPVDPVRGLEKVEYDPGGTGTGYPWTLIDDDAYTIRISGNTMYLQFLDDVPYPGKSLRLTYQVRPSVFTADTSTGGTLLPDHEAFAAFICARATAALMAWRSLLAEEAGNRDHWIARAQMFQAMADGFLARDIEETLPVPVRYPRLRGSAVTTPGSIMGGSQDRVRI